MVPTLSQKEFELFQNLIYSESGIKLNSSKKNLVQSRLQKRLRQNSINSFCDYYDFVNNDKSREELVHMIDCISTNKTHFFREIKHFELLGDQILPNLINDIKQKKRNKLRIWCAASSSGEEPYTIAMLLSNNLEAHKNIDAKILATDISTKVLRKAINGVYGEEQVVDIPRNLLNKYFSSYKDKLQQFYKAKDTLRDLITYRKFNLLDINSLGNCKFDVIFCRNVMIYFDNNTKSGLVKKFYEMLLQGGFLFISHSETLSGRNHDFKFFQPAVYQKL